MGNEVELSEHDLRLKVNQLNNLFTEIQSYKREHPELRSGYYEQSLGSILNAYREGDLGFDEAIVAIGNTRASSPSPLTEEQAKEQCSRCSEEITQESTGEPWQHVSNDSIYCPNDDTGCAIATPHAPASELMAVAPSVGEANKYELVSTFAKHLAQRLSQIASASRSLCQKLRAVHDDPQYRNVWATAQNHLGQYSGATYTEEVAMLESTLETPCKAIGDGHLETLKARMGQRAVELHKEPGGFVSQMAVVAAQYVREQVSDIFAAPSSAQSSSDGLARRAAEKIDAHISERLDRSTSPQVDTIRKIIESELAATSVETDAICWHCGVVLAYTPKLRCENCPDECDLEGCNAMGCSPPESENP